MGQKILAYLFYGFLILIIISALILLKYQLDHKEIKQQQIDSRANVVTHTAEEINTTHKSTTVNKTNQQESTINVSSKPLTGQSREDDSLSYLDVYYQLKDAKTCQPIFSQWQINGSQADLTALVGSPYQYYDSPDYGENEKPPLTAGQQTLLKQWHNKCQTLWQMYGDFDVQNEDDTTVIKGIAESIEHRLNNTATQTPREVELKSAIKISLQWQQRYAALEQALLGEDSLSEQELADINSQKEQLQSLLPLLYSDLRSQVENGDGLNQSTTAEINTTEQEISRLTQLIQDQKVVNQELVQQKTDAFNDIDQQLFSNFNTSYGEVFYEALITVVGFDNLRYIGSGYSRGGEAKNQRITPVDMVLEANDIRTNKWYIESLNTATHLYLCGLGMRCGSDSPLMFDYCLRSYRVYPDACGLSIPEFYKNHLISPNQWQDVQTLTNSYEDLFHG